MPSSSGQILSPATNAVLTNSVSIVYQFSDTQGITNSHTVGINGRLLGTPTSSSGNEVSGTKRITWDTRRDVNGTYVITVSWVGHDGNTVTLTRTVVVTNTHQSAVSYRDFVVEEVDQTLELIKAYVTLWLGPLDLAGNRILFGQAALYTDDAILPVDEETTPEAAQGTFDSMRKVPMIDCIEWPNRGFNKAGRIVHSPGGVPIPTPSQKVVLRLRSEPSLSTTMYDTGSDVVRKISKIDESLYMVWSSGGNRVHTFNGVTLTLVVDLSETYGYDSVTDVAMLNDKVYFINNGTLYAYDTNSEDTIDKRLMTLAPVSTQTTAVALEVVQDKLFVLYSNTLTECYSLTTDQFDFLWSVNVIASGVAWTNGVELYFASEDTLYAGTFSVVEIFADNFGHDIVKIGPGAVILENGEVWTLDGDEFAKVIDENLSNIPQAVSAWFGSTEIYHRVIGDESKVLREQLEDSSFGGTITLEDPDEAPGAVSKVSALCRFSEAGAGVFNSDERLLVGTGNAGILYDVRLSRLSEADGAWRFTTIEDFVGTGVSRTVRE